MQGAEWSLMYRVGGVEGGSVLLDTIGVSKVRTMIFLCVLMMRTKGVLQARRNLGGNLQLRCPRL